jgi:porphobilinogen synthase
MDYRAGVAQAMLEASADVDEGADILMVKPAAAYLDVIAAVRQRFDLPLAAYHVSGEYAMIKAAARNGWVDERAAALEITGAIRRAGADLIITYFAEQLAEWIGGA